MRAMPQVSPAGTLLLVINHTAYISSQANVYRLGFFGMMCSFLPGTSGPTRKQIEGEARLSPILLRSEGDRKGSLPTQLSLVGFLNAVGAGVERIKGGNACVARRGGM
jgi:hypothetical protein